MLYLWENPKYYLNKLTAVYDRSCSPSYFLFRKRKNFSVEEIGRGDLYMKSSPPELPDDPFIRKHFDITFVPHMFLLQMKCFILMRQCLIL